MKEFILQHKRFSFYSLLVAIVVGIAIFAPYITPHDAFNADMSKAFLKPSAEHLMGTDKLGRDTFSRIIYGTQTSLFMTMILVILTAIVGTVVGILSGFFGGKVELVLMRFTDIMLSFPGVVLAIAIAGIMGGSAINAILALVVVSWAKYARMTRSAVIKLRHNDFIAAYFTECSASDCYHRGYGYWDYDDGSCGTFLLGLWGTASDARMGFNAQ